MAIKINDIEITGVQFNGNPIYTVVHVDKTTKKETIVFGGTVQPPAIVSQVTATYNTLTFLVKNMDYRVCNITVFAVPMTSGHVTRSLTYTAIPASGDSGSQFTCYMGADGEQLDSDVQYKLFATALTGTDQSESSVPVYATTLPEYTYFPSVNTVLNYYPTYSWNVTNNDDNDVKIKTWITKEGVLVEGTYYEYDNIKKGFNTSTMSHSTKSTLIAGSRYIINATAQDYTGKIISSTRAESVTMALPENTLIPLSSIEYPVNNNIYNAKVTLTNRENESIQPAAAYLFVDLFKVVTGGDQLIDSRSTTNLVQPGAYVTFDAFTNLEPGETYYIKKRADGYDKYSSGWSTPTSSDYLYTKCQVAWIWREENSEIITIGRIDTVDRGAQIYTDTQLTPTRVGWYFEKWNQPQFYFSPYYITVTTNLYIEAVFQKSPYTVTWYSSKDNNVIKTDSYIYKTEIAKYTTVGSEPKYPANPADITVGGIKYSFLSWNPEGPYIVPANNSIIYANWKEYGYAKWWDGYSRENIAGSPPLYIKREQFGANQPVPSSTYPWLSATDSACISWINAHPRSTKYKFKEWIPAPGFIMPADGSDKEITAQWIAQYYGIWYNGRNAYVKGGPDNLLLYDNLYQLSDGDYPTAAQVNASFGTEKYFFTGWDKLPNTLASKFNGADILITATSKPYGYARWWYNFPVNDYEFTSPIQLAPNATIASSYPSGTPLRAGYRFKEWSPTAASGPTMPMDGTDKNIYAQWTQLVNVTWKTYDGSITYGTTTLDINSYITSKDQYYTATRSYYDWDGWSLSINGALISFGGSGYQVTQDITLYAIFTPKLYILTFLGYSDQKLIDPPKQYRYTYSIPSTDIPISYGSLPDSGYTKDLSWDKVIPQTMPAENLTIKRLYEYYTPAKPSVSVLNIIDSLPYIKVSWNSITYAAGYRIRYYYTDSGGQRIPPTSGYITDTTTNTNYIINPNNDYGRSYYISVEAYNNGKSSGYNSDLNILAAWALPVAPTLTYTISKDTSVYINTSWTKPTNADDDYILRYKYTNILSGVTTPSDGYIEISRTVTNYPIPAMIGFTYTFSVAAKRFGKVGTYSVDQSRNIVQYTTTIDLNDAYWASFTDDIATSYAGISNILTRINKSAPSATGYTWSGLVGVTYPLTIFANNTYTSYLNPNYYWLNFKQYNGTNIYDSNTGIQYPIQVAYTSSISAPTTGFGTRPDSSYTYDNGWSPAVPATMPYNDVAYTKAYAYYYPVQPSINLTKIIDQSKIAVTWQSTNYSAVYNLRYAYYDGLGNRTPASGYYNVFDIIIANTTNQFHNLPMIAGNLYYISVEGKNSGNVSGYPTDKSIVVYSVTWSASGKTSITKYYVGNTTCPSTDYPAWDDQDGYTFSWNKAGNFSVTSNTTVTGTYTPIYPALPSISVNSGTIPGTVYWTVTSNQASTTKIHTVMKNSSGGDIGSWQYADNTQSYSAFTTSANSGTAYYLIARVSASHTIDTESYTRWPATGTFTVPSVPSPSITSATRQSASVFTCTLVKGSPTYWFASFDYQWMKDTYANTESNWTTYATSTYKGGKTWGTTSTGVSLSNLVSGKYKFRYRTNYNGQSSGWVYYTTVT